MITEQKGEDDRERKEFPRMKRFGVEHAIALAVLMLLLLLLLLSLVGLVASYLDPYPYSLHQHDYVTFLTLLSSLVASLYALKNYWNQIRGMLLLAGIAGLVVGIFLGSISNLPYYLGVTLCLGAFGPFLELFSNGPSTVAQDYKLLDISLSTLAVLLSCTFYALVAFFVTYRARNVEQGIAGAFLAAFICVVVATFTFTTLAVFSVFPTFFSQRALTNLAWCQSLPLDTFLLSFAQAVHAFLGGFVGSHAALRYLRKKNVSG